VQHQDILCFSHLRWDFVYQRPNHLMRHFSEQHRVFFVEEPVVGPGSYELRTLDENLQLVVPHVPAGCTKALAEALIRQQLMSLCAEHGVVLPILWFYTPMYVHVARGIASTATVYDCMDELANFRFAPCELVERERELMGIADLMFTGGMALYEAKRHAHSNVHGIPSSVDVEFFARARQPMEEPTDQECIPHPRIGYYGAIDERIDLVLLEGLADARPDCHFLMLGPVVKIDPESLPKRPNLHFLGLKTYDELPAYIAGWDVAMMPFALNEATRYISPTKTPEYLAAGKPVVSTPIHDVVDPYGRLGLVRIARDLDQFVQGIEACLSGSEESTHLRRDAHLASMSWKKTFEKMRSLLSEACEARRHVDARYAPIALHGAGRV